jgi:uncharacterized membrane protein
MAEVKCFHRPQSIPVLVTLASLLLSAGLPAQAQAQKTMVCNAISDVLPVLFGRAYQQADGRWTTEGTWEIPPGRCLGLYPRSSKPFTIYYAVLHKDLTPLQYGGGRSGNPMLCLGIPRNSDELTRISNQPTVMFTGDSKSIRPCNINGGGKGRLMPFIRRTVNPGEAVTLALPGGFKIR